MEHLVNLIDAIAWPGAAVWLGYIFRAEIRKLLERVSGFKYRDFEAKFDRELAVVEEKAKIAIPESTARSVLDEEPVYPAPYDLRYEQLLRISEESPRAALLEAWVEVESALNEAAERFKIKNTRGVPPQRVVIGLIETGQYAKTVLPLFDDLRKLRNEAAHAHYFVPNKKQFKRYLQIAIEMALTFRNPLYIDN